MLGYSIVYDTILYSYYYITYTIIHDIMLYDVISCYIITISIKLYISRCLVRVGTSARTTSTASRTWVSPRCGTNNIT